MVVHKYWCTAGTGTGTPSRTKAAVAVWGKARVNISLAWGGVKFGAHFPPGGHIDGAKLFTVSAEAAVSGQ